MIANCPSPAPHCRSDRRLIPPSRPLRRQRRSLRPAVVVAVAAAAAAAASSNCITAAEDPLSRFGHQIDLKDNSDKQHIPSSYVYTL